MLGPLILTSASKWVRLMGKQKHVLLLMRTSQLILQIPAGFFFLLLLSLLSTFSACNVEKMGQGASPESFF